MRQEKYAAAVQLLAALTGAAGLVGLSVVERDVVFPLFLTMILPVWTLLAGLNLVVCWNRAVSRRDVPALGVFFAALLFAAVVSQPVFSDDIYRYLWEGRVVASGENPYLHAPDSAELEGLRAEFPEIHAGVNHPGLSAIYPPLPQFLFAGLAFAGGGLACVRVVFLLAMFGGAGWLLARWARVEGIPTGRLAALGLLPIAGLEIAVAGHLDALVVLGVSACVCSLSVHRRDGGSSAAAAGVVAGISVAVLSKLMPLLVLPHLALCMKGWRHRVMVLMGPCVLLAAGYLPFAGAGGGVFSSFEVYGKAWSFNGPVYRPLSVLVEGFDVGALLPAGLLDAGPLGEQPAHLMASRVVLAVVYTAMWAVLLAGRRPFDRTWLYLAGGGLLLSPVVHPWYLLALIPGCVRGGVGAAAAMWWMLAIPFTYVMLPRWWSDGVWEQPGWTWLLQYGGMMVVVAMVAWWRAMRRDV